MNLRDLMRQTTAPHLRPGEPVQAVFGYGEPVLRGLRRR
jgi:hypothetical protein